MIRETLGELDVGIGLAGVPGVLRGAGEALAGLLVRDQGCVRCRRRLVVVRVGVGGVLVLGRSVGVLVALEECVRQEVVGGCGIRIAGEGLEVIAIPARRLLVVGDLLRLL